MAPLTNYQINKAALLERFPEMEKDIFTIGPQCDSVEFSLTKKGDLCARLNGLALHSLYDPCREADRIVESRTDENTDCGVFIGFGLGYTVESFMRSFPQADVLVYEPDPGLFLRILQEKDFSEILRQERLGLLLGSDPSSVATCLQRLHCREVSSFSLKAVNQNYPELCGKAEEAILRFLTRRQVNINTLKKFGKRWVRNFQKNLDRYQDSLSIHRLAGKFTDIPSIVIAAGPSLDQALPYLAELQKRFLLIAVDTASRALSRNGMEPDIMISVDPQYWNSRHLDPVKPGRTLLVSEISAYPTAFRQFTPPFILCPSSFPLSESVEKEIGITGKLYSGGSVATAGWEVARVIGCPSLAFLGLDLAYPDKKTHYNGSFFEQRLHSLSSRLLPVSQTNWQIIHDVQAYHVPDNRGGQVLTDKRLSIYQSWFWEQTEQYPGFRTTTLSPEGIRIDGIKLDNYENLLDFPVIRPRIDAVLAEIRSLNPVAESRKKSRTAIQKIITEMRLLLETVKTGKDLNRELAQAFSTGRDIQPLLAAMDDIDRKIMQASGRHIAAFILQPFIYEMTGKTSGTSAEEILSNSRDFYNQLDNALTYHIELFSSRS